MFLAIYDTDRFIKAKTFELLVEELKEGLSYSNDDLAEAFESWDIQVFRINEADVVEVKTTVKEITFSIEE